MMDPMSVTAQNEGLWPAVGHCGLCVRACERVCGCVCMCVCELLAFNLVSFPPGGVNPPEELGRSA